MTCCTVLEKNIRENVLSIAGLGFTHRHIFYVCDFTSVFFFFFLLFFCCCCFFKLIMMFCCCCCFFVFFWGGGGGGVVKLAGN